MLAQKDCNESGRERERIGLCNCKTYAKCKWSDKVYPQDRYKNQNPPLEIPLYYSPLFPYSAQLSISTVLIPASSLVENNGADKRRVEWCCFLFD